MRLLIGISLGLGIITPAMAYDDPAVAVCEWYVESGLSDYSDYKRLSFEIEDTSVTLRYEVSALGTMPKEHVHVCEFAESRRGSFDLVVKPPDAGEECNDSTHSDSELEAMSNEELEEILTRIETCREINSLIQDWFEALERGLNRLPIYPIAAEDTKLRAPGVAKEDRLRR